MDTHVHTRKLCRAENTGMYPLRWADCVNASILAIILYYNFERCCHWGKYMRVMQALSPLFLITAGLYGYFNKNFD